MGNANSSSSEHANKSHVDDKDVKPLPVKQPAADGKVYFSYADVHDTVNSLVPRLQKAKFEPTVLIAIGYVRW